MRQMSAESLLEHLRSPSSEGTEDSGCQVSSGIDGVATVAAQRDTNQYDQEADSQRLTADWSRLVSLIW